jgi:hypothetical protein
MRMLAAFQVHKSWFIPAVLVLVVTGLADAGVAQFVTRPLPWVVIIPATIPLSLFVFVGMPLLREERRKAEK